MNKPLPKVNMRGSKERISNYIIVFRSDTPFDRQESVGNENFEKYYSLGGVNHLFFQIQGDDAPKFLVRKPL